MEKNNTVPYAVYESTCARHNIHTRRLVVALIVSVALMFASNLAWLIATTAHYNTNLTPTADIAEK